MVMTSQINREKRRRGGGGRRGEEEVEEDEEEEKEKKEKLFSQEVPLHPLFASQIHQTMVQCS